MVGSADALIEGFRPGVMERLGLGPEVCLARNPRLVYGRMTGWGQEGPLAGAPGHDLNYIAVTGALAAIGPADRPVAPLNLIGDFGGGAMYLAFGVVCGLLEAARSGRGQVVDAAMVDGTASLMTAIYGLFAGGSWRNARESNFLDGAAPFYRTYACADGKWIAVAAIEDRFYRYLLDRLGIAGPEFDEQWDEARWPQRREKLAAIFRTRSRDQWCAALEGSDACVSPVLDLAEAPRHPQIQARGTFVDIGDARLPGPAPRFSRTDPERTAAPGPSYADTRAVLRDWGLAGDRIEQLARAGAI
jgi:alpha-methylacyl-CoA racemase